MAKGYGGGMPMNMNSMLKQAQKMQKKMQEAQEELAAKIFEVSAGGGAVKIEISGSKEIKSIALDPDVVDPDDIEMLQDLLMTAVNEALRQVDEASEAQMGKLGLPGGMPGGAF